MSVGPVLLIDHDREWCDQVSRFLGSNGYEVVSEGDSSAALAKLPEIPKPSAVLLDIAAEGAEGRAFCRAFREMPAFHDVPLFLVTAASAADVYEKRVGINGYLRKTVALEYLLVLLNGLPSNPPRDGAPQQAA